MNLREQRWSVTALGVAVLLGVSACSSSSPSTPSASGASTPVVLGLLAPLSGAFADVGTNLRQGAQVAIDQINAEGGVLGGRQLKLNVKDTSKGPQQAAQAVRDFIASDQKLVMGELSSANCLAEAPLIEKLGGVFVIGTCTNRALTGQPGKTAPFAHTFRVGATDIADMVALYKVMKEQYPNVTTYDVFAFNYVSGHEEWVEFRDGLKANGMSLQAGKEFFVALTEQNYRSQISALAASAKGSKNRGLYLGTFGSGTGAFLKQALPFDLVKEYDVIVSPGEYHSIARELGGKAPDVWNGYDYSYGAYDTAQNKKFVSDFEKIANKKPITWSYQSYLAVKAYAAAIEKAKSTNSEDVTKALRGITFDSPQGTYTIDPTTQQGSANIVITHTVGDPSQPEGLKISKLVVVTADQTNG